MSPRSAPAAEQWGTHVDLKDLLGLADLRFPRTASSPSLSTAAASTSIPSGFSSPLEASSTLVTLACSRHVSTRVDHRERQTAHLLLARLGRRLDVLVVGRLVAVLLALCALALLGALLALLLVLVVALDNAEPRLGVLLGLGAHPAALLGEVERALVDFGLAAGLLLGLALALGLARLPCALDAGLLGRLVLFLRGDHIRHALDERDAVPLPLRREFLRVRRVVVLAVREELK